MINALSIVIVSFLGYLIAYNTYGKFLAQKIFNLSPNRRMPSEELEDGQDYVPTEKGVVFGHHFTSIAGTGPIVGPAIGVIWGWVPALLWIFFGSIFMGAVHDFSALVISLRNDGKSIAEVTSKYISRRVQSMFFIIVFLALLIVIAIFGLVIALIFKQFPQAVAPVWAEIPIAIALGAIVAKKKGNLKRYTLLAKVAFLGTFALGYFFPIYLPDIWGIPATGIWTIILLVYAYFASVLPVTTLLQPRDFLNAWQLYLVMGLLIAGMLLTGITGDLAIVAPAFNLNPAGAPPIWPFLFITIACGAVSGFHSLVGSGTTSKQIKSELDAKAIGFGAMLVEGFLATLVIIAVTAGIGLGYLGADGELLTGLSAWQAHYGSWAASSGLGSKLSAVVIVTSNMISSIGIPKEAGIIIMGVFIASFAGTTLDSATRIQRYIVTELFVGSRLGILSGKKMATGIAVLSAAILAFSSGADGKGALMLWPMFGAVNQLLAALAFMVGTIYLRQKGGWQWLVTGLPCVIMLVLTLWASIINELSFLKDGNMSLIVINGVIVALTIAMIVESGIVFKQGGVKNVN